MSEKTYEVFSNLTSYQANVIRNLIVVLIHNPPSPPKKLTTKTPHTCTHKKHRNYPFPLLCILKIRSTGNELLCTNISRAKFVKNLPQNLFLKYICFGSTVTLIRIYTDNNDEYDTEILLKGIYHEVYNIE